MKVIAHLIAVVLLLNACKKSTITEPIVINSIATQTDVNLTIDGIQRNFLIYQPTGYNNAGKMPMIIVMHGGGGYPSSMLQLADFKTIAEREKVILIYPSGTGTSTTQNYWNDGRPTTTNTLGVNDVSFISQLCSYAITNYAVDATKIYATGISNGGFMASRLGCELSDKIAAIAVVAASMEQHTVAANCNTNGRTLPALYIQGTVDPLVPFLGGTMTAGSGGVILSHAQAIVKWVVINNCVTPVVTTDVPDIANDGTTIKQRVYGGGTNGSEVVSYVVTGGGHTWPQGSQYLGEAIIGKTSLDMNANEVIWQFFKRFKR
jgi:polyhydroxybutyrate depolymerase